MVRPPRGADAGSAALYVLWLSSVLLVVATALGGVAVVRVANARAASAADLAALAGAAAVARGEDGCARVHEIARRSGATARDCSVGLAGAVDVLVEVPLRGLVAPLGPARARARAGPAAGAAGSTG